ncbi:MAG: hypothetical protein HGA80_06215 [Candidatus Omnitrophica bacterium]|nr:hypothetical protein [Candidatus Omnitrophota bacterium]
MERLYAGYVDAYKILVMIGYSHQQWGQVEALSQTALRIPANEADRAFFFYFFGAAALHSGDTTVAARAFEECLKLDSEHVEALAGTCAILKAAGREDVAQPFVDRLNAERDKKDSSLPGPGTFRVKVF